MNTKGIYLFILWLAMGLIALPCAVRAQESSAVAVREKHTGGYTSYYLRNGGLSDLYVMLKYKDQDSAKTIRTEIFVAAGSSSADVTTSQTSSKPVIVSQRVLQQTTSTPTPTPSAPAYTRRLVTQTVGNSPTPTPTPLPSDYLGPRPVPTPYAPPPTPYAPLPTPYHPATP